MKVTVEYSVGWKMPEIDKANRMVARRLGLDLRTYGKLMEILGTVQTDGDADIRSWNVVSGTDDLPLWQATVGGFINLPHSKEIGFVFHLYVTEKRIFGGGGRIPDRFMVTDGKDTVFSGEVLSPSGPGDMDQAMVYDTFKSVRLVAFDAVCAALATGRPVVRQ